MKTIEIEEVVEGKKWTASSAELGLAFASSPAAALGELVAGQAEKLGLRIVQKEKTSKK